MQLNKKAVQQQVPKEKRDELDSLSNCSHCNMGGSRPPKLLKASNHFHKGLEEQTAHDG